MPAARPHKGLLTQEPSATHKALADYITKTTGHTVPVGDVALVQRLYPKFLKSPEMVAAKEAEAEAKAAAIKEKTEASQQRLKDRLAKLEEDRQRVLKQLGIETDDETAIVNNEAARLTPVSPAKALDTEVGITVPAPVEDKPEADEPVSEVPAIVLGESTDEFVEPSPDDDEDWDDF